MGTVACAQNLDTISHSKKAPQNTQTQSKKQGQDFNKINFTGSYLAARAARINFDFDNAQKNAENSDPGRLYSYPRIATARQKTDGCCFFFKWV